SARPRRGAGCARGRRCGDVRRRPPRARGHRAAGLHGGGAPRRVRRHGRRRPLRGRLQGDQPARGPHLAPGRGYDRLDRRWAAQGRGRRAGRGGGRGRTARGGTYRPGSRPDSRGIVPTRADGARRGAALGRRWRCCGSGWAAADDGPGGRRGRTDGHRRRHRAARPSSRVDGHVHRLRPPRAQLRPRRGPRGREVGHMALAEHTRPGRAPGAGPEPEAGGRPDLICRIAAPLGAVSRAPLTSYHVVMVVTCLLTVIGLGMVLSSSNVLAFSGGGTPFDIFLRQALFVAIGWVGFMIALRMRIESLRAAATPLLLVSIGLLVAVLIPGIGTEVNGSRGWINLGFFSIQPAEIGKLAFIVWASSVVARRIRTGYWLDLLFPAVVGYAAVAFFIVIAPDLGMATATTIAFLCLLWFAGYPARHFLYVLGFGAVVFGFLAVAFAYRFERVQTFFSTFIGDFSNPQGSAYQSYQGMLSLADGRLFGVGLGQSSAK